MHSYSITGLYPYVMSLMKNRESAFSATHKKLLEMATNVAHSDLPTLMLR